MELETKNHRLMMLYLPHELIIQILMRLPVKSLIGFKCVCKSWFSLISSDTQFANSQFHLTVATNTHRVLLLSTATPHQTRSIELEASLDDDDSSVASLNPNFMLSVPFSNLEIKGSCRGFILLFCYSSFVFYLWNPSTGIHKQIPLSPLCFNLDADFEFLYGFGYDQSKDDYLIVTMSYDINQPYLEFFSFRANTWKQTDEDTRIHYSYATEGFRQAGSFFNGAIHWFAHCLDLQKDVIVVFDLMERKLLDMHLPNEFDFQLDCCGLWVFQEFLSLWAKNVDNDTVEMWVMKEYKLHSSWTMTRVLSIDAIPNHFFSPLSSTKSGGIVGTDEYTGLVKYNDEGQLLGHRSYVNDPHGFQVAIFTESLLSLSGDNVQA